MADDILRAAVTQTSQASSHAVTQINTVLLKFHRHLYDSFAPTTLIEEFDKVLDKVDEEVRKLNSTTLEIGARIREKGGSVVDESTTTSEGGGVVVLPPSNPVADLKVLMDGLGSGHPQQPPVGKPSRPPPLPPDAPTELSGGGGSGGDPTAKVQALLAQLRRKREEFFLARGEVMPPSPPPLPFPPPPPTPDANVKTGSSRGEVTLLKEERKSLELELLAAHRAISALEQRLHEK